MECGAFLLAELDRDALYRKSQDRESFRRSSTIPVVALIVYFRAVRDRLHAVPPRRVAARVPRFLPRLHLLLAHFQFMVYLWLLRDSPFLAAAKTIGWIIELKGNRTF